MIEKELSRKEKDQKAGHYEILGESLAKFEFYANGWHPYSRFLDVDKVDIVLRRRVSGDIIYREIQVKLGTLFECKKAWEKQIFSHSSWRFFTDKNIDDMTKQKGLFLAYVLLPGREFKGDIFIFPIEAFAKIVKMSHRMQNGKYNLMISRSLADESKWFVRRKSKFAIIDDETAVDVSFYHRNFPCLEEITA